MQFHFFFTANALTMQMTSHVISTKKKIIATQQERKPADQKLREVLKQATLRRKIIQLCGYKKSNSKKLKRERTRAGTDKPATTASNTCRNAKTEGERAEKRKRKARQEKQPIKGKEVEKNKSKVLG